MAELHAGGLAIIIRSPFPENVGKVVKLVTCVGKINYGLDPGIYWEVEALSELSGTLWRVKSGLNGLALAKNLMPIDDFSNEDEQQREREYA